MSFALCKRSSLLLVLLPPGPALLSGGACRLQVRDVHTQVLDQISGVLVDVDDILVQSTALRDEVHATFPLLLLQLQADAAHIVAPVDTLHQMCGEACDLVTHALGRACGNLVHHALVHVKVICQLAVEALDDDTRAALNGLCTNAALKKIDL